MRAGFIRKDTWFPTVVTLLVAASVGSGCGSKPSEATGSGTVQASSWTYPIHLGDSRAKAHEFLGNATRTTDVLEEYPMSGVTLWYDPEGRLTKLNFQGTAGAIYSGPASMVGANWIPSDRSPVFSLTTSSDEGEFARVLGAPVSVNEAGPPSRLEIRRVWRKDGYVIDALFLGSERTEEGRTLQKGGLVWFEISRGL